MRQAEKERVECYRKAYPEDPRMDGDILRALDTVKTEKRYMNKWVERQVYENFKTGSGLTIKT